MVFSGDDGSNFVSEYRTSTSAYIHRHQTYIVKCLEQRFAQFQGGIDVQNMEPFQVVKYIDNQQVKWSRSLFLWMFDLRVELILIGLTGQNFQKMVPNEWPHFSVIFNRIAQWVKRNSSVFHSIARCINNFVIFWCAIKNLLNADFDFVRCLEIHYFGTILMSTAMEIFWQIMQVFHRGPIVSKLDWILGHAQRSFIGRATHNRKDPGQWTPWIYSPFFRKMNFHWYASIFFLWDCRLAYLSAKKRNLCFSSCGSDH